MSEQDMEGLFWAGAPVTVESDLFHIYGEDGRSLCGRYHHSSINETSPVTEDDSWRDGKDCKACSRKAGLLEDDGDA